MRGENGNPGRFEAFFGEVDDGHDLPLHATGSAGGLYDDWLFGYLRVPFNVADREETSLRELGPNLDAMRVVHLAYVGRADSGCQRALPDIRKRLQDHFSSKPTAIEAFRQWIVSH